MRVLIDLVTASLASILGQYQPQKVLLVKALVSENAVFPLGAMLVCLSAHLESWSYVTVDGRKSGHRVRPVASYSLRKSTYVYFGHCETENRVR